MPVEPGIIGANILIYALDADAAQHLACRTLLEAAPGEAPTTTLYVTSQILCEFYAVVTNARRVLKPRYFADALAAVSDLLGFLRILPAPVATIDEAMALLRRRLLQAATHSTYRLSPQ